MTCGEAGVLLMWREHEGEAALLLGLRRRPARRHHAKLGRRESPLLLLVCIELLLLGVERVLGGMLLLLLSVSMSMHVGHRSWSLRRMGNLSGPGLLLLYLKILEPWQRREEHIRNLRVTTGS